MAKISTLKFTILLTLSALVPSSVSCEEQPQGRYILAIARLYAPKYVISPSEEVGGPFEGEIYLGGVYEVRARIVRTVSGSFDVVPKRMRLIANSPKYFTGSVPKLLFIRKYPRFGYRIDSWYDVTDQESRNVCLLEADVKSLVSGAMFTASDGKGRLCEHKPDPGQ